VFTRILTRAGERAAAAQGDVATFKAAATQAQPVRSLASALSVPGLGVVAEIKRRSPSVGVIDAHMDPAEQAAAYVDGGADAISVLTEPDFFDGSMDDLAAVRAVVDVPLLRKDFILSTAQIWEARAGGADAILLIVAALDQDTLEKLVGTAAHVGVEAIVETHTADEVRRAAVAGARIIGVNNRDLATFHTDLTVAESIARVLPRDVVTIAESGVSDVVGARRMVRCGYDAILVGEALVRSSDPSSLVRDLKAQQ